MDEIIMKINSHVNINIENEAKIGLHYLVCKMNKHNTSCLVWLRLISPHLVDKALAVSAAKERKSTSGSKLESDSLLILGCIVKQS